MPREPNCANATKIIFRKNSGAFSKHSLDRKAKNLAEYSRSRHFQPDRQSLRTKRHAPHADPSEIAELTVQSRENV